VAIRLRHSIWLFMIPFFWIERFGVFNGYSQLLNLLGPMFPLFRVKKLTCTANYTTCAAVQWWFQGEGRAVHLTTKIKDVGHRTGLFNIGILLF